jgi:hypothetical protein
MFRILRIPIKLLYETMEKWKNWCIKDGYLSRSLLSWVLLALFFNHGIFGLYEYWMDGIFSLIIFGEKIWSRGIWISKLVEMTLIIVGFFGIVGVISLYNGNMNMTSNPSMNMDMNTIGNMKDKAMRRNISFERF